MLKENGLQSFSIKIISHQKFTRNFANIPTEHNIFFIGKTNSAEYFVETSQKISKYHVSLHYQTFREYWLKNLECLIKNSLSSFLRRTRSFILCHSDLLLKKRKSSAHKGANKILEYISRSHITSEFFIRSS